MVTVKRRQGWNGTYKVWQAANAASSGILRPRSCSAGTFRRGRSQIAYTKLANQSGTPSVSLFRRVTPARDRLLRRRYPPAAGRRLSTVNRQSPFFSRLVSSSSSDGRSRAPHRRDDPRQPPEQSSEHTRYADHQRSGRSDAESRIHIHAVHDAGDRDGASSPVLVDNADVVRAATWSSEGPQIQRKLELDVCVFTGAALSVSS